jgi:putative ABC transport system permease protein
MLGTALSTLFSHWRRHPGQLAMLVLGLALATALWSGVQAINTEARSAYDSAATMLGQDRLDRLVSPDGRPVPLADYIALRRAGYLVSPVISGELREGAARLRLVGIDPLTAPPEANTPGLQDEAFDLAAFFTAPGLLLMTAETATGALPPDLPPVRVTAAIPPGAALTDIGTAARLLGQDDPSYLMVWSNQPPHLPPLTTATALHRIAPEQRADPAQLTESFHLNLTAFGLLAFAVGLFIVHAAIGLAFEQRRTTIRTLRALGLPLRSLLLALGLELAGLALFAGLAGLILGYAIAAALMPGVAGSLRGLYGADLPGTLSFDPIWALSGLGMSLAGTALAGAQAMGRTARLPILAPALPQAWRRAASVLMRRQALLALALLALCGALAHWGESLILGFVAVACLFLGAALMLPITLAGLLRLGQSRARGPIGTWVLADTGQQLPGLSLALMALLLAVSANIGVSTMVGSFRATFTGWLDQRLVAELYVSATSPAEAALLADHLARESDAVLPVVWADAMLAGRPGAVYGQADHPTFRDHWPLISALPDAWNRLATGEGVLINEQLARFSRLSLGEPLTIAPGVALPILGIYSDYGNPEAQAIVTLSRFRLTYPAITPTRFALRIDPAKAADLASALRRDFDLPADAVINQTQIKRFSLEIFEQTFLITGALNMLTLGVAGFALLTGLLTLADMRLPQLAPVWALGITRARLARLEMLRSLILAGLTFALALPVGLALAWMLLAIINVQAFGWRLPMQLFPADLLRLLALALVAACGAAALPALRLARTSSARLLRVFAHEA